MDYNTNNTMSRKSQTLAHWQRMRDDAPGVYAATGERPNGNHCPYCLRYTDCEGCPIAEIKSRECKDTPFREARSIWWIYQESMWNERYREAWQRAADAEIAFIETLPEDENHGWPGGAGQSENREEK